MDLRTAPPALLADPATGERDVTGVLPAPAPEVLASLRAATDVPRARLATDLPDRADAGAAPTAS